MNEQFFSTMVGLTFSDHFGMVVKHCTEYYRNIGSNLESVLVAMAADRLLTLGPSPLPVSLSRF